MQPDVVFGVPGRVHRDKGASRAHLYLLAVGEHVEAFGRRGVESAVEGVEQRPVDACCGVDEPGRIGQVPRPLLVHVDRGRGKGAGHVADAACMVEMDVGDRHPGQFPGTDTDLAQGGEQDRDRRLASGLDEHRCRPFDQVPGRHLLPTTEHGVDLEHAGCNGPGWRDGRDGVATLGVVHVQTGIGMAVRVPAVRVPPAHGLFTSITTFTSSGSRSSASCHRSSGTRRVTSRSSQARSARASASAAAS